MTDLSDAYGRLILDYYENEPGAGAEIIERDDGFTMASGIGPAAYFAPFRRWPTAERQAMRLVRGRVLDIGSGAGRVALHLQKRGHDVVGIDTSHLAIEVARKRGAKDVRELSVTQVGPGLGRFDTIVMFGNNFGLMGGRQRAPWLFRRFKSIANEGARIIAESVNPYTTDNPDHLAFHERNRRRGRMPGQLRLRVVYGHHRSRWFDYLLASPEEMAELAEGTGWELSRVIDEGEHVYVGVFERVG